MGELCEVCGRRPATKKSVIEGVMLNVCTECAGLGKEVVEKALIRPAAKSVPKRSDNVEIVDDYADILRKRISALGLKYKDLARSINENESYLRRVVRGETIPTVKLARKLERALNVKIIEEE